MNPLDPSELSAFLDRELPAERMPEIEALAESDPGVRAELESLASLDAHWRASARSAAFRPTVNLRSIKDRRIIDIRPLAFFAVLIVAQTLLRAFNAFGLMLVLDGLALVVLLAGVGYFVTTKAAPAR
jgi:anti-sigma factor RsiW